jgi:stage V sporulation protein R
MELINQHTKKIMEGCKERAWHAGLRFQEETLEYIVTNKDLLELSPKNMIPTLYDYWVHDVEVLKEKGKYELYPHNPYETVINTRPPISFYNDNNPDWLNVMIFYHVLGHIDFFQNNMMYRHTWNEDFTGQALSDKRFIAMLRSEKGRWVDYVIEFARSIDNLVGFFPELSELSRAVETKTTSRTDFYFDVFLQSIKKVKQHEYLQEIERYNQALKQFDELAESVFFSKVAKKYPEFESLFKKDRNRDKKSYKDLIQYLQEFSPFLKKEENKWMKSILQIARNTSIYFQPQIRTKILNEGWASYWHEKLFLEDDRINGNEVDFARVNAKVTALPRVGLNPYALGMRLFSYIEKAANKGKFSYEFQRINDVEKRAHFDRQTGAGQEVIFKIRENFSDYMFINTFIDQDFVKEHKLFVSGKRLNDQKGVWEYYVKSRDAKDYRQMLSDTLYHPPHIEIDMENPSEKHLKIKHHFEGKPLVKEFIQNTMLGIEYLWGGPVKLETTERVDDKPAQQPLMNYSALFGIKKNDSSDTAPRYRKVIYTMENKKLSKEIL